MLVAGLRRGDPLLDRFSSRFGCSAFGFFGPIRNHDTAMGRLDEALQVLVPTTLSCLQVLAESDERGWRLAAAFDRWCQTAWGRPA
jgi:hypothetical protein